MQLFFFDTETTGFTGDIIQFGAIFGLYDEDTKEFHEERIINQYINTDKNIEEGAFKVHGITKEKLKPFKKMDGYIKEILAYINKSDIIIGHNIEFDLQMLKSEMRKFDYPMDILEEKKTFDTMKGSMQSMNYTKRPKLAELHKDLFQKEFDNAHDAMADIRATKDCFLELLNTGKIVL